MRATMQAIGLAQVGLGVRGRLRAWWMDWISYPHWRERVAHVRLTKTHAVSSYEKKMGEIWQP